MFRTSPTDVVQSPKADTYVNWTAGFAWVQAKVVIPRVSTDRKDHGAQDVVFSLSDARAKARDRAASNASVMLMDLIHKLPTGHGKSLAQLRAESSSIQNELSDISSRFLIKSSRMSDGFVTIEMGLPFYSEKGLMAVIATREREEIPEMQLDIPDEKITGLIIDATDLPQFQPALETAIFTDQGRQFYGSEMAKRSCVVRRGSVVYYYQRESAFDDRRLGRNPYYVVASGLVNGNIYVDSTDAARILHSGRSALERCAVAILVAKK